MYIKKIIFLFAALLMLHAGSFAQKVKLVLVKGEKYEQTTTTSINSMASAMGQEMASTLNNTTVQSIHVIEVGNNGSNLDYTTTRVLLNSQVMGQEVNFDSDKKDSGGPGT
ncbi:MAG TPA: hypothetical protein VHL77_08915, partial [Ferruginibacter sp.]|nr:hypothetical protein [Ferruginibacter sp.]